ncbi:MAG: hypothetical protein ACON4Z_17935, partial [Planctomycetota bacterium]
AERAQRPGSMREVHQRLEALRTKRGRRLRRAAWISASAAAALALFASDTGSAMFLRPKAGSALSIADGPLMRDAAVQHLRSKQLSAVEFDWGGIRPERLVAELARGGKSLARVSLAPKVDRAAGTLVLAEDQASWRALLERLARDSAAGPVELAFLVPGSAALGAGRIQLDDRPPSLEARLRAAGGALRGDTTLALEVADDVGLAGLEGVVLIGGQPACKVALPTSSGTAPLGRLVADELRGVAARGAGEVRVRATDLAGNVRELGPLSFDRLDVAAPAVLRVSGPAGQRALTRRGDRLRFRVELSAGEPGLELRLRHGARERALPVTVPASDRSVSQSFDVDVGELLDGVGAFELQFVVRDPVGNEVSRSFPLRVVDRSPEVLVEPRAGAGEPPAAVRGAELVIGPGGGRFALRVADDYRVARVYVERDGARLSSACASFTVDSDGAEVSVAPLGAGAFTISVELEEQVDDQLEPVLRQLPLRVLPAQISVQVPANEARFVPELVDGGVLARSRASAGPQVAEGVGWRYPAELRPYIRGVCFRSGRPLAPVRAQPGPLLPVVALQPGRTALALSLEDTLGRAVSIVDERGAALPVEAGRATIATFWWSDAAPAVVGERLLVERDRPLRLRVRVGLPLQPSDRDRLRLGLGSGEWPAVDVEPAADASELIFEVPFAAWGAAAQLLDLDRQAFARGLDADVVAYLLAPSGRSDLALPLRTTRSTLAPVRLGAVTEVPRGLEELRLLPVLAPDGPFAEPVPDEAPPRATFRPQQATAVRNMPDILLQDRELTVGEARALVAGLDGVADEATRTALVHAYDPLGAGRLAPERLLPAAIADAAPSRTLVGVDFFQAWTLTRLLGVVVGGTPDLFRLPLGCELELAAFSEATRPACSGAVAHGAAVPASAFLSASVDAGGYRADASRALGDAVPTAYGRAFLGLDFGVREWVLDVPHVPSAELLLREWIGDHAVHLSKVLGGGAGIALSAGRPIEGPKRIGVVRGLAFGEAAGLVGLRGERLEPAAGAAVPACVPGVLRTEQLRRDGRALLGAGRDERLLRVGFRVAADAERLLREWGFR